MKTQAHRCLGTLNGLLAQARPRANGLLTGKVGLALYYLYYHKVLADEQCLRRGHELLQEVLDSLGAEVTNFAGLSLAGGLSGLLLAMTHLHQHELVSLDPEVFSALDEELLVWALAEIRSYNTDFLYGAVGVLHYFSLRPPTPFLRVAVHDLVAVLAAVATVVPQRGLYFPNHYTGLNAEGADNVYFATAHGLCGVLLTLLNASRAYPDLAAAETMICGGVQYLLSFYQPAPPQPAAHASLFPSALLTDQTAVRSKGLAWCAGDLNALLVLARAGQQLANPQWTSMARLLLTNCARVAQQGRSHVEDPYFCHGAAGVAEIFRRLHLETGWPEARQQHQYWIGRTLEYAWQLPTPLPPQAGSLLDGLPGLGLSLLSYVSAENLAWGECLLL